ncbi:MAG TPA: hypothetical protein VM432_08265 [Bdellovibrionales bacterium]|nr:hypothetical protein [Bdellovibrionales bacterium]
MSFRFALVASLLLAVLQIGCASLGKDADEQAVLVRSNPPGAAVEVGGKVVGFTPTFVLIERKREPEPILIHPYANDLSKGELRKTPLDTRYRWGASFGANFLFSVYAPIGWGIDFLTGAAWDVRDPEVVALKDRKSVRTPERKPLINLAIAPPLAESLALSDIAAQAVESRVKASPDPRLKIRSYNDTLPTFLKERFDFDSVGREEDRRMLLHRLGLDGIYYSTVERFGSDYVVKVELRDGITNEVRGTETIFLQTDSEVEKFYDSGRAFYSILPNTVGLMFANESMSFTSQSKEIELKPVGQDHWWEKGLEYLSAIRLSGQPVYRSGRGSRWLFHLYPDFRFSHKRVQASGKGITTDQKYARWLISGGYGPEAGYQFGRHYLYASLIPSMTWTQISWTKDNQENALANFGLTTSVEFGYLISFAKSWSVRLFIATYGEDQSLWTDALKRTINTEVDHQDNTVSSSVTGIVLGYNFESAARRSMRIKKSEKERPAVSGRSRIN